MIGRNAHVDIQTFNTVVQKMQTHLKKQNITYPFDV